MIKHRWRAVRYRERGIRFTLVDICTKPAAGSRSDPAGRSAGPPSRGHSHA
jgi:hypothetical protein